MIPACLWFIARDKQNNKFRDRGGEILFIDARKLGKLVDRRHRELSPEDVKQIADIYHAWRGELIDGQKAQYADVAGFCKAVKRDEIRKHGHLLTPGRYVGSEEEAVDGEEFDEKMKQLVSELNEGFKKSGAIDVQIKESLKRLGYGT